MKKTLLICSTVLVLAIGIGLTAWLYLANKNETAYQEKLENTLVKVEVSTINAAMIASTYQKYWDDIIDGPITFNKLSEGLNLSISTIENMVNDSQGLWSSSRAQRVYSGEINTIISLVKRGKSEEIKLVLEEHESISQAISELKNPPKKFKETYDDLLEIFELYDSFSSISTSPVGSYIEYSKTINATYEELSSKIKTAQLQL